MTERLLLHILPGLDGTSKLFAPLRDELSADFDLVAAVYPDSPAATYAGLRQAWLQVRQPGADADACPYRHRKYVLLAESYSTPLAIMAAATRPKNLLGVVLCAGFASNPLPAWQTRLLAAAAPLVFRAAPPRWAVRRFLLAADSSNDLVERVIEVVRSLSAATLTSRLYDVLNTDVEASLDDIKVPTLWLQPAQDRLISPRYVSQVLARHPNIRAVTLDGPHLLLQTRPHEAAVAIREFARSCR